MKLKCLNSWKIIMSKYHLTLVTSTSDPQEAIRACPPEVEPEEQWAWGSSGKTSAQTQSETAAMVLGLEQDRRRREEHARQVKLLIGESRERGGPAPPYASLNASLYASR